MSKKTMIDPMVFDERLRCGVLSLSYDFQSLTGNIYFPDGHCCDFSGCIGIFTKIDPRVLTVKTHAGDAPDTEYRRAIGGKWKAIVPHGSGWIECE